MQEIWKPLKNVVEYGDNYAVSSLGRLKNLLSGKVIKGENHITGYIRMELTFNKIKKRYYAHRLVATAFIPNPENKPEVNHKDGNKKNNDVNNLEWVTVRENSIHAYNTGLMPSRKGETGRAKLTEDNVIKIKELLMDGANIKLLASTFKVAPETIHSIKDERSWSHVKVVGYTPFKIGCTGEANGSAKITEKDVLEIRRLKELGFSTKEISSKFNLAPQSIWRIVTRKSWTHI